MKEGGQPIWVGWGELQWLVTVNRAICSSAPVGIRPLPGLQALQPGPRGQEQAPQVRYSSTINYGWLVHAYEAHRVTGLQGPKPTKHRTCFSKRKQSKVSEPSSEGSALQHWRASASKQHHGIGVRIRAFRV